MDRFLIAGAALLLVFEVAFLVTGLDESSSRSNSFTRSETTIGTLVAKKNSVHRRGTNTLIWDETQASDPLYAYDSVLTLSGSSANLILNGETKLDLDQDTLVVLEPSGQTSDGRLKIRFARGSMRTKNASDPLVITGDDLKAALQISTEPGTALHLAGLDDGRLHVEVEAGAAKVESGNSIETIGSGGKLLLRDGVVEERSTTDRALIWQPNLPLRVYAKTIPVELELAWEGEADSLKSTDAKRTLRSQAVRDGRTRVNLAMGQSRFWLAKGERTSATIEIDVRSIPALRLFSPLPRDRVKSGHDVVFSWEAATGFGKYQLEISKTESFVELYRSLEVETPRAQVKLTDTGTLFWRVKAIDDLGVAVPPSRVSSFSVVPLELEAPTLNAPEIREPADDATENRDGVQLIFDLLVPRAHAESKQVDAVLSWQPMNGAEFYVIEISSTPGFESTLVSKRLTEPKYVHRGPRGAQVFWRVAAGAGESTGPFSAAAVLKLEGAKAVVQNPKPEAASPPKQADVATAQARIPVAAVAPATPTPAPVTERTPEIDAKPEVVAERATPEPTPEATPEAPPVPVAPVVSFAEKSNRKLGRLVYAPHFRQSASTNELGVQGSFSGPIAISFAAHLYLFESEKGRVELGLAYEEAQWKPLTSGRQADVKEQRLGWNLGYRSRASAWSFAVAGESLPLLARKATEEAELQTQSLYGVDVRFTETMLLGVADFELALRSGTAMSGGRLRSALDYQLGHSSWFVGPHLSLEAFQGSSNRKLTSVVGGIHLGVGW